MLWLNKFGKTGKKRREEKRRMGKEQQQQKKMKIPKQKRLPLNPNWAQLQQELKSHGSRPARPSNNSKSDTQNSILGKRKDRPGAASDECQPNPLTPTNDDFSLTDAIAMDCEMVGIGQGNKSALGRVTLVNEWGNVIYDEFVRPIERVVDFRTKISGIRPQHLRKAKDFPAVQKKVAELIRGRILVGHALSNDLKVLLLCHPKKDLRDTVEYQPFLKERRRRALRHLAAEFLGVKIQDGEHCSIEDARATMLLYQKNKKEWEKSVKNQIRLKEKQKKRKQKRKPKEGGAPDSNHVAIAS
ncbi:RNA exonuclease 4 isoform X2 [Ricinus communis]|uniref:RNA exonuclease 4 n=1 Tax=Ricinus communis TaxID=3988 RepID=B9RXA0_RICCO|nr:RNA exonuclease 4 isoform X2 [Ricinus communis]EEF44005.1 RNA exonuclease, putative [Ricinus communis]|eukprot:XP_002518369.1 RNA exonuclease 4 isoform X2 [Ricinus communis]